MKNTRPTASRGFSLVELMIAMTIGLLIALVVTQAYLSGLGTQRTQSDVSRAQEAGRFVFQIMGDSIRKSGYRNPTAKGSFFCDNSIKRLVLVNDPATIDPAAANLSGTATTIANKSDVIRVRYFGESDGSVVDCLGNSITANTLEEDTLYVANDANNSNEPTLYCYASNAASAQPLIPGVESLQMLYGESTAGKENIDRYVTAANVADVNNVRSVMISVITRTPGTNNALDLSQQTFNHFGTDYVPTDDAGSVFKTASPSDGRIRQRSTTVVALRNICPTN